MDQVNSSLDRTAKCCGSCKWLTGGVEPHHIRKDGVIKERYRFTVFTCSVPFDPPTRVPACMEVNIHRRKMMAPYYGVDCSYHEPRK